MFKIRSAFGASSWLLVLALVSGLAVGCGPERERDEGDDDEKVVLIDQCLIHSADKEWLEEVFLVDKKHKPGEEEGEGKEELTGREIAREGARGCGQENLNRVDEAAERTVACMKKPPYNVKISAECSYCYSEIVLCTIDRCLKECIGDSHSQPCKDCQKALGCDDEFYTCSGLPPEDD